MVRQDVGCGGRRIIVYNQPAEDSELVECNNPGKKINDTGQPGLEARRHSCKAFHRYGCAHIRLSDDQREIARRAEALLRILMLKGVSLGNWAASGHPIPNISPRACVHSLQTRESAGLSLSYCGQEQIAAFCV